MKIYLLRGLGLFGILLFLPLFLFTFSDPTIIEKSGKDFIEWKLQSELNERVDFINSSQYKTVEKIFVNSSKDLRLKLEKAKDKLADFTQSKYNEIVEKLTMDIRIFLGVNSLVFILLFWVSFLKPQATEHLFLPGTLIFFSTAISSYFYLFEQNWFYTILYNDYVGFGYLAYLGLVFAILCDIVFNKARVTTEIINFIASAIGSAFSVATC
ncbi:MAG: hypothetical protein PHQ90_13015 [Sulfuricurvum sp.]|uniref:hypothetical protein n=1 Tax=Sulfuricurvum sp. TaxID=2025608 RepID=UPI0026322C4F|nr:hypothetical protein [Sulfuricurvum sp.]MDD2370216.1 hypothetical protein [Sulfuricurvum sp.]MDD2951428.1 hypothetical protein [Sulfuricurvum sp.]MDD5117420.1 hypothetical protein [Sulfuricurvum sp.]